MKRLVLLGPALLAGCYSYAAVDPGSIRPGMSIRARVSAATAERVAPLLGVSDARVLTGTMIERGSGGMIVEVPTAPAPGAAGMGQTLYQRISIAPGEIVDLESRKLDRTRTGLVLGGVAIVGGSAALAALRGGPGLDHPPGGSGAETKIPLLRFHF